jgi:hypothetical protein
MSESSESEWEEEEKLGDEELKDEAGIEDAPELGQDESSSATESPEDAVVQEAVLHIHARWPTDKIADVVPNGFWGPNTFSITDDTEW